MIIDFIINLGANIFTSIVNILPDASLPSGVSSAFEFFIPYWQKANSIVPMTDILSVIGAIIAVEIIFLTFKGLVFLYRLIPGKFT